MKLAQFLLPVTLTLGVLLVAAQPEPKPAYVRKDSRVATVRDAASAAEVVSADALQVYAGIPILTNQAPTPTRLTAFRELSEEMSVGEYATLAHDAAADDYRAVIAERWGRRALVSLAFAITASRLHPTVKYALGHGQACSRLTVAGSPIPVLKEAA